MAKKSPKILSFVAWLTGVIVSLSVGFAMIDKILSLPSYLGGPTVAVVAGYIVVLTTAVGIILALIEYFK